MNLSDLPAPLRSLAVHPGVLGLLLTGSRARGTARPDSDWDFLLLVRPGDLEALRHAVARLPKHFDGGVMTLEGFAEHAAWGSPTAWDRYRFARLRPQLDRTGGVLARLIADKGRVPPSRVDAHIRASLDHALNQVIRAEKLSGLPAHLEVVQGVVPLLSVWFALHDGRLCPYPKYLSVELTAHPLTRLPLSPAEITAALSRILEEGDAGALRRLLALTEPLLREEGFGAVFDAWGARWRVSGASSRPDG